MQDTDSELIRPVPMTPFNMTDSLSPTFEDHQFPGYKDSRQYFCTDPNVQKQIVIRSAKPLPEKVMSVVKKSEQERTTTDNNILYRYLLNSVFFKQFAKQLSADVVKQILRQGKIKLYQSGDLLNSCGKKVKNIRILLHGQVGVMFEEEREEKQIQLWEALRLLVQKLGRQTKNFKFKHSSHHQKNLFESIDKLSILKKETMKMDFDMEELKTITAQTLLNYQQLLNYEPKYSKTLIVTADNSLIMTLTLDEFYESLLVFYNSKQNEVIKLFRNVSIFNSFENSKLKLLVQRLNIIQKKKNQYVYCQGDKPSCFYMLIEGEVEVTKTVDLLEENPNNFYKNRLKVSKEKNNPNIKVLPYANFKGVYNYQQESKIINLITVHPISIFGQEQLIQNTQRQVNAKITSLTAKMYQITLTDIQDFCLKISGGGTNQNKMTILDFFSLIQEGITMKKILFRQHQLSEMLYHQNKNKSKNIFQTTEQENRHHKSRVISKRRSVSTAEGFRKNNMKEQEAPPTFNNFNFTQFMSENEETFSTLPSTLLTSQQTKVMKLTHIKVTSDEDIVKKNRHKQKAIRLRNVSKDLNKNSKVTIDNFGTLDSLTPPTVRSKSNSKSSINKITLDEPLFTVNYFKLQEQLQRKLHIRAKKMKLDRIYGGSKEKYRMI